MNPKNEYTLGDIKKMQKEAIKRVQDMQNRERKTVADFNKAFNCNILEEEKAIKEDSNFDDKVTSLNMKNPVKKQETKSAYSGINRLIDLILKDEEKALIIILILILLSEDENPLIVLALIYTLI